MTDERETLKRPQFDPSMTAIEKASEWGAYLQSGLASDDDIAALKSWLSQSEENKLAFQAIMQSWEDVGIPATHSVLNTNADREKMGPDADANPGTTFAPKRWLLGGIAASVMFGFVASYWFFSDGENLEFQYATAMGETLTITLDDRSTIVLGGESAIEGDYSKKRRRVELTRGRAFFDVEPQSQRPFQVIASNAEIVVAGTAFDVVHRARDVQVSVTSGRVSVTSSQLNNSPARAIDAGEKIEISLDGVLGGQTNFDAASLSWRSGQLAYVDARLGDIIAEVNRYRSDKIRIADSHLNDMRVSFSVRSDQTDILLAGLEATLPIEIRGTVIYEADGSR